MRQTFKDDFAKSAFSGTGENTVITGKYGVIQQLDTDCYDIWFVGKNLEPLSGRRIASLGREDSLKNRLKMLNGEAYLQVSNPEEVRTIAPLLGIKKRRQVTQAMRDNFKKMKAAQSPTISDK